MVAIAPPPPSRSVDPQWLTLPAGFRMIRIYNKAWLGPVDYNHHGPRGRFDHHASGVAPARDPERGVYYAADTLPGCIIEVFGDAGIIEPGNYGVAEVGLVRELKLLDLTSGKGWNAGTVAAIAKDADRAASQPWARYFYHTYPDLDGFKYENAHNDDVAYVLFERAGTLDLITDRRLADKTLEDELFRIADSLHLQFFGV